MHGRETTPGQDRELRPAARMRQACMCHITLLLLGSRLRARAVYMMGARGHLWLWSPTPAALLPGDLINVETLRLEKWTAAKSQRAAAQGGLESEGSLQSPSINGPLASRGRSVEWIRATSRGWWGDASIVRFCACSSKGPWSLTTLLRSAPLRHIQAVSQCQNEF